MDNLKFLLLLLFMTMILSIGRPIIIKITFAIWLKNIRDRQLLLLRKLSDSIEIR